MSCQSRLVSRAIRSRWFYILVLAWFGATLGHGYPTNILKSVTRVCIFVLTPKMVKSSGGAAAVAKPATKGVMSSAKNLADRAKAARAEKR